MEREYIVTLNENVDYEKFRLDMVQMNAEPYIPERQVTISNARPASKRNTHYMLTEDEAGWLINDPRVFDVELNPQDREDIGIGNRATQESNFTKTTADSGDFVNWGLRRMISPTNPYTTQGTVVGGYTYTLTGEGVDVVIMDSGIQANHPEFQDANGNSRVQEIDWYAASGLSGTMPTEHYTDYDGHGTHCAGIAAGKTYGWAKNSRIYAIKLAGLEGSSDPYSGIPVTDAFDIIKEWHKRKKAPSYTPTTVDWNPGTGVMEITIGLHSFIEGDKIKIAPYGLSFTSSEDDNDTVTAYPRDNLATETQQDVFYNKELSITAVTSTTITVNTGLIGNVNEFTFESAIPDAIVVPGIKQKRPTIVNMSWGYFSRYQFISGGNYRGTAWSGSSKNAAYGMTGVFDGIAYRHPIRVSSVDVDMDELIEAGVNVCVAAGNNYHKIADADDPDYNNYYTSLLYGNRYYHRGSSPFSTKAIMVGNIDSQLDDGDEQKAQSSETGPGVDIYAPGTDIMSSTSLVNKFTDGAYPQDENFRICNISGTSMAAPQIAGLLATYGEISPNESPAQMKTWLEQTAKSDQIQANGNENDDYTNYRSLMGGNNLFAFQEFNSATVVSFAGQETIAQVQEDVDPTYALTVSASAVDEGESFTVTLQTTNVVPGTIIPYTITGVSSSDIDGASLVDNFIQGVSMQKTFTATEDNTFDDGPETFRLTLNDVPTASVSVTLNDTSKPDPIYALAASATNVDEGATITFTATATNVLSGTQIPYTITGIESADIGNEPLTGNLTVPNDLTRTYTLTADGLDEGQQTMTFTWANQSVDVLVNDTSNVPITYTLTASETEVDEGDSFTIDLSTIGGLTGTVLNYTISGVSSLDISNASLSGSFTVGSDTQKTFVVSEDFQTEGNETFRIELNDISPTVAATVTINDTSTTVVSGQEVLTNAGSGTFTVPAGVSSISIMAVGGGAGSGTVSALGAGQISGGGGSGAVAWLNNVTVNAGDSISYTVGEGGAGNNDGGDTTVTIGGTTYTAGGGSASAPVNLTDLDSLELHAGGAGGTASGAWTGSVNGGVGGSSYRSQAGEAIVGGGAGGSGTGAVGQTGYPTAILDPRNARVAPGSFTASEPTEFLSCVSLQTVNTNIGPSGGMFALWFDDPAGNLFGQSYSDHAIYLAHRWNEWVDSITMPSADEYYLVFRTSSTILQVHSTSNPSVALNNGFLHMSYEGYINGNHRFAGDSVDVNSHLFDLTYDGNTYAQSINPNTQDDITVELRSGASTGATDANTVLHGSLKLLPQGDTITNPGETAAAGGGQGYTEDWASGTGIVVGGKGGATTMSKGLSNSYGSAASSIVSQSINGAGTATFGGAGGNGNTVSSVAGYAVGAGAGGVMVHGLAPSGQRTRAESGTAGGILIVWPGAVSTNQFKAPSYTLNSSKTNCNEGSSFTITCANNLTESADTIPFTITGVSSADIGGVSLTQSFGAQANNKVFNVTADDSFEGAETFNLALDNGADDIDVTINDTSDGTQETLAATITNSGASAYVFASATDRNGTVTGSNPNVVVDKGDTINWTVNASGHPLYIKDVQGTGTGNATANVTGQGATNGTISYTPAVDGRKYYQCSSHNDMHGEIYICDDHWMTNHIDSTNNFSTNSLLSKLVVANDGSSLVNFYAGEAYIARYTKHGSPIWSKSFADVDQITTAIDSSNNIYVAWNLNTGITFYVQKLNSAGEEQWGREYTPDASAEARVFDMTISANGNIIVTGMHKDGTNYGLFVCSLSGTNGDVITNKRILPSDRITVGLKVATDTNNNIYISGTGRMVGSAYDFQIDTFLKKFDSSLTLQWERWYEGNQQLNNTGLVLDNNGSPIIGLTHRSDNDRSYIVAVNGTTGVVADEFELDANDRATYKPNLVSISYDNVNSRIIAVGSNRIGTATGPVAGFVRSFDTELNDVVCRQWRATDGSYSTRFLDVAVDSTLTDMNRVYVLGGGNNAKVTARTGMILGSLPFNDEDVSYTDTAIDFDEYRYLEQGTVTTSSGYITVHTDKTETIDNATLTATGATGEGTLDTALTGWEQQKMALFWGANTEDQEASDPTYALTASATSIDEGQSFTVTLDTTNVPDGTNVPYTITGVSSADIGGVSLTGTFTVVSNSATITINVTADLTTD